MTSNELMSLRGLQLGVFLFMCAFTINAQDSRPSSCDYPIVAVEGENQVDNTTQLLQYYVYYPEADGELVISTCGSTDHDTWTQIYEGCDLLLAEADDNCGLWQEEAVVRVEGGKRYTVVMGDFFAGRYEFRLAFIPDILTSVSGVDQLDNSLKLYPNPASSTITINGVYQDESIEIYDAYGRQMKSLRYNGIGVDVASMAAGIYWLKYRDETLRFIKE